MAILSNTNIAVSTDTIHFTIVTNDKKKEKWLLITYYSSTWTENCEGTLNRLTVYASKNLQFECSLII